MQVISLFTSGVMLGLKLAQVTALPAMWGKLSKWRSRAQPLCEAADAEGTELHEAPADTTDAPITAEEYAAMLHQIEAAILALAGRAGPQVAADKLHLHKLAHKLAMLAANAKLPSAKLGAPPAGPQVLPSPTRPPVCTSIEAPASRAACVPPTLRDLHTTTPPDSTDISPAGHRPGVCARRLGPRRRVRAKRNPRSCGTGQHTPPSSVLRCAAAR